VTPEALTGGALARVRSGDVIRLDADAGILEAKVDAQDWSQREPATIDPIQADDHAHGLGRELFAGFRRNVNGAEQGACSWL
jgi:phosphogluconate dehydratase